MRKKCLYSFGALLSLHLCAANQVGAQTRSWRMPVDLSFIGCFEGKAKGALMDDGTLLVACMGSTTLPAQSYNNAPIWQRSANGSWSMVAQPPTPTSRTASLRKLSGSIAAFTWAEYKSGYGAPVETQLQIWTAEQGMAPPFAPPGIVNNRPLWASWGPDAHILRFRIATDAEVPPPPPPGTPNLRPSPTPVFELIDRNGQPNGAPLVLTGLNVVDQGACIFPNGDRLLVFSSIAIKEPPSIINLQAAILRKSGTWEGPVFVFGDVNNIAHGNIRPICLANGVARVFAVTNQYSSIYPFWSHYADLAGSDGWRPQQALNIEFKTPSQVTLMEDVLHARSLDGRAVIAWNVSQSQPDALNGQAAHASIPIVHWLQAGSKYFSADISVPGYNPDSPVDVAVRAVAWDPKRERFVFVLIGGAGPMPRRMLAELIPGAGWPSATPLPSQMLSDWQLDFNASGDGVLFARRHGQLLISEWR